MAATIEAFASRLRGPLLCPGGDAYEAARTVWNGLIDRRPGLIARCAGAADVSRAIDFDRTHQLLVSVRGGGHNVPGNAVCDGGLMIDLAGMRSIRVALHCQRAQAEGGTTWAEFDHETQAFGLATTGGASALRQRLISGVQHDACPPTSRADPAAARGSDLRELLISLCWSE